jgi:hypothetical protein
MMGEEWQEEDQQSLVDVLLLLVSYTEGRRPALQGDKKMTLRYLY